MLNRNIFRVSFCVFVLPVVFTQFHGQYTPNNQLFLEKYFPGRIQLEGRRFDNGGQFQEEGRNGRDSWVGIPSLNLRPYELIESYPPSTKTTTTTRPTRTTHRPTTTATTPTRATAKPAWLTEKTTWQTQKPTWPTEKEIWLTEKPTWPAEKATWPAEKATWSTEKPTWPAEKATWPTEKPRWATVRTTRRPTRPTTKTTVGRSESLALESILESNWNFNPNEWTPKVRSLTTTRTPITVIATTQTPITRYASIYTNKSRLKKIKTKKNKKPVKKLERRPSQQSLDAFNEYNQGQYFLRITPPTRRPIKTSGPAVDEGDGDDKKVKAKKKMKKTPKKEDSKKPSSGGGNSPGQPANTFLNQYTAVTLAPGVDPQNPVVQHLIMTYGDKNSGGVKKTRTPKRLEENGMQAAERTLLLIGLMFSWSFWIVVFLTGLKHHHVTPGPTHEEVHVHHLHPPNRILKVDDNDYGHNGHNLTAILQTIRLAHESFEESHSNSTDCHEKVAMCGSPQTSSEKESGLTDSRIKRKKKRKAFHN